MKISIITPSFNQAQYIEQTIQSVLSQKGDFHLEYIIIDGGSTDATLDILKKYTGKISWTSEKDRGQSDAINKGFKKATGDIIGWLNSDDLYEPDTLNNVARFFKKNPAVKWVYGKCRIIDEKNREIRRGVTFYKNLLLRKYSYNKLLAENFISQPAVFFRREILDDIGYLDLNQHIVMDYDFWLRIGKKHPAGVINKYLASFRWYTDSKSGSLYKRQFRDEFNVAKNMPPNSAGRSYCTTSTYGK